MYRIFMAKRRNANKIEVKIFTVYNLGSPSQLCELWMFLEVKTLKYACVEYL